MGIAGYAIIAAVLVLGGAWALRRRPGNRRTDRGAGTVYVSDTSSDRPDSPDAGASEGGGDGGGGDGGGGD